MLMVDVDTVALSFRAWELAVQSIAAAYRDARPFVAGSGWRKLIRRYETIQGQGHAECTVLFEDGTTRYYIAEYK